MGTVISIANQKGGVGKTTTSVNLAAALATLDRRILLVDLDPQGNATMGSGINKKEITNSINEALLEQADIHQVLLTTQSGYDILPANQDLTIAEINLLQMSRREFRLRQILLVLKDSYDFVIIDCPPSLNMLTVNALVASDGVIIPMQCEYYALEGLSGLLDTISQLSESLNPKLHIIGIIRTMYDARNCLTNDVSSQLIDHFDQKVYETVIPRNVRLAEAPSYGMPAIIYDKRSVGAAAYIKLAEEMLQKQMSSFEIVTEEATAI